MQTTMTIEYALTRTEVVSSFFRSMRSSWYPAFMLVCILALFIFVPESGERFWHPFQHEAKLVASGAMTLPLEEMDWDAFFAEDIGEDVSPEVVAAAVEESRGQW